MATKKRTPTGILLYLLRSTWNEMQDDHIMKFSAALAYYTVFSLGPLLLILISLGGLFFGKNAVEGQLYGQVRDLVGSKAALLIQETIKNIHLSGQNILKTIIGVLSLLLGASGVFGEIQDSINSIWGFKSKPRSGLRLLIINRLLSFSMVAALGFLLMVSLFFNVLLAALGNSIGNYFPGFSIVVLFIINNLLTFAVISLLFAIIFKVLPDARIRWKDVRTGAMLTALLFMLGKYLIGLYLGKSQVASAFGATGSVILIMVWVYYNAVILYAGAEFTQVLTRSQGREIQPNEYAVKMVQKTVEAKS